MRPATDHTPIAARRGYTLVEIVVVLTIMGVLIALPAPYFVRAVEQAKLDVAGGNLRAIWAAERLYFLQSGRFGLLTNLGSNPPASTDLIDGTIVAGTTFYAYSISVSTDGQSFTATATHPAGSQCAGSITINQAGTLVSSVTYGSLVMTPSLEPHS
jgi:prepilin-type N-terminal cleavage/methylation domain-containing protein